MTKWCCRSLHLIQIPLVVVLDHCSKVLVPSFDVLLVCDLERFECVDLDVAVAALLLLVHLHFAHDVVYGVRLRHVAGLLDLLVLPLLGIEDVNLLVDGRDG